MKTIHVGDSIETKLSSISATKIGDKRYKIDLAFDFPEMEIVIPIEDGLLRHIHLQIEYDFEKGFAIRADWSGTIDT